MLPCHVSAVQSFLGTRWTTFSNGQFKAVAESPIKVTPMPNSTHPVSTTTHQREAPMAAPYRQVSERRYPVVRRPQPRRFGAPRTHRIVCRWHPPKSKTSKVSPNHNSETKGRRKTALAQPYSAHPTASVTSLQHAASPLHRCLSSGRHVSRSVGQKSAPSIKK